MQIKLRGWRQNELCCLCFVPSTLSLTMFITPILSNRFLKEPPHEERPCQAKIKFTNEPLDKKLDPRLNTHFVRIVLQMTSTQLAARVVSELASQYSGIVFKITFPFSANTLSP